MNQRESFNIFFPDFLGSPDSVRIKLIENIGKTSKIHSSLWKYFLLIRNKKDDERYVNSDDWMNELKAYRRQYDELAAEHLQVDGLDPLNEDFKSIDKKLYNKFIDDHKRSFNNSPHEKFFHSGQTTFSILCILVFSLKKTNFEYVQGMSELASYFYYTLSNEMTEKYVEGDVFSYIFDREYVVHDTFALFYNFLQSFSFNFDPQSCQDFTRRATKIYNNLYMIDNDIGKIIRRQCSDDSIVRFNTILVEWFRLAFTRVFAFEDVPLLWDIIFSYLPNTHSLDNLAQIIFSKADNDQLKQYYEQEDFTGICDYFKRLDGVNGKNFAKALGMSIYENLSSKSMNACTFTADRLTNLSEFLSKLDQTKGLESLSEIIAEIKYNRDILLGMVDVSTASPPFYTINKVISSSESYESNADSPVEDIGEVLVQKRNANRNSLQRDRKSDHHFKKDIQPTIASSGKLMSNMNSYQLPKRPSDPNKQQTQPETRRRGTNLLSQC